MYNLGWSEGGGGKKEGGGVSGREEKGVTDGERRIDKERRSCTSVARYLPQTLVIIPC